MPAISQLDRVRGSLLGLAVGDALGAPLEGLSAQQIRAHYGTVTDYVDGSKAWRRKPFRWRLPGLYTDDTQQALAITDVLLTRGCVEPERLAEIYVELATPEMGFMGAHRGIGKSFRNVLVDLKRGVSPRDTGQSSVGIGAAMRIAPVGLFFGDDPEALFLSTIHASLMTHRDIRSLSGAMAVALGVSRLLKGESRSPSFALRLAADLARVEDRIAQEYPKTVTSLDTHGRSLSNAVAHVESIIDLPRDRALAAIVDQANRHGPDSAVRRATQGFPPACIPTCLYLLLTTDSIDEALVDVVNLGGDADSTGAILGAFIGAALGVDAIPSRWLAGLQNQDAIDLRAQALHRRSATGLDLSNFVAREHELSAREVANRESVMSQPPSGGDLGVNRRM